jgi:hypothetical protein
MGGVTDDANATTQGVQADFESVLGIYQERENI